MGSFNMINCDLSEDNAAADTNNSNLSGLMQRVFQQRISFKRSRSPSASRMETRSSKKRLVIDSMPRCSSYENLNNVLHSFKKVDNDAKYTSWKRDFEQHRPKPVEVLQIHNMSSAVSGGLTPKGFPAFTQKPGTNKRSLQVHQPSDRPRAARTIHAMHYDKQQQPIIPTTHIQQPKQVAMSGSTFSTLASSMGITQYTLDCLSHLAKMSQDEQAVVFEKLFRSRKDVE